MKSVKATKKMVTKIDVMQNMTQKKTATTWLIQKNQSTQTKARMLDS
jgi:hypothetical protein